MKKKYPNILFLINPTDFNDFDVIALGDLDTLQSIHKKEKYTHLIKKSRMFGCPILIMDTFNTLRNAAGSIKEYKKSYKCETKKELNPSSKK